jgi:hypothetical protein
MKDPVKIVITGGAGQIAYSLIPPLASGVVFGADQPVIISLLDITPAMGMLGGVVMEVSSHAPCRSGKRMPCTCANRNGPWAFVTWRR